MQPPEPYDPPWRWLVQSPSRPGYQHLVDLAEGPDGECSCEDFQFRGTRCKHISATRDHVLNLIINHHKNGQKTNEHGHSLRKIGSPDV